MTLRAGQAKLRRMQSFQEVLTGLLREQIARQPGWRVLEVAPHTDLATIPDSVFHALLCARGPGGLGERQIALRESHRILVDGGCIGLALANAKNRYVMALREALADHQSTVFDAGEDEPLETLLRFAGFVDVAVSSSMFNMRLEPTQQWLLRDTAGTPYADPIASMDAPTRAAMLRRISASLKDLWRIDSFEVPVSVQFSHGRKGRP
jgi:hypothetical protein